METLKRIGKWALYGLFALYAISSLVSAITQPKGGPAVWVPVVIVAVIAGLLAAKRGGVKNQKTRIQVMADEATAWAASVDNGTADAVDTMGIITPHGEKAYLCERGELAEVITRRRTGYAGTRVKVGNIPLLLGGSESFSRKEMAHSDSGTVMLTDRSLVFVGSTKTLSFTLRDILQVRPSMDAMTINVKGRQTPVAVAVRNPLLWAGAINTFAAAK